MGGQNLSSFPPMRNAERADGKHVSRASLIILVLTALIVPLRTTAQLTLRLPGGIVTGAPAPHRIGAKAAQPLGAQANPTATFSFGTINALAVGTPASGVTVTALSNGAIYFFTYTITVNSLTGTDKAEVTGSVTSNFTHTAALIMENCPSNDTCTTSADYSVFSTSASAPSTVVPSPGIANGVTATAGFGLFVPDNDGVNAFTGSDAATVTLNAIDIRTGANVGTAVVDFTPQTLQDAVQLTLTTATGGLTVTPASDYSMTFGNVNGLGIGPATGLTTVSASGGTIYSTPYVLNPAYGDFTSTTATLKVDVSTNFAHPTILQLEDSGASGGPYTAISTNASSPTVITTTAADRSQINRFLGLFVGMNNSTPFTGSDSATLTFTMTVP